MNLPTLSRPNTVKLIVAAAAISATIAGLLTVQSLRPQPASAAGTYAPGFSEEVVTDQVSVPTGFRFAPDGRIFVIEKGAFDRPVADIKIVKNGQVSTFATIPNVQSDNERGLLGIVLDPDFATNRYVYVAYTGSGPKNRVARLQASSTNPDVAVKNGDGTPQQTILLDNIPSPTGIHQVGELQFGKDGKLYIPSGDGAIDSQAAQKLDTLGGKILRINKDGTVPTDNPFFGQAGKRAEIWAYGVRNSFTSDVDPVDGRMFFNDVGQDHWEEINRIDNAKGANFGWRTCEGLYVGGTGARCSGFTDPIYSYNHYNGNVVGRSISGGAFYRGSLYPADYNGDYFFADYVNGFIKRLDQNGTTVSHLATGLSNVVNIETGPDGKLYYVSIDLNTGGGKLVRINYGNAPPPPPPPPPPTSGPNTIKVFAAGSPAGGVYPTAELLVNDQVVATFTNVQGNQAARQFTEYSYTHPTSVGANQVKVRFPNDATIGTEDRNLFVDKINIGGTDYQSEDPSVLSTGTWTPDTGCAPGNKQQETLSCGGFFQYAAGSNPPPSTNQAPNATVTSPAEGAVYRAGEAINFSGTATDPEDGELPASAYAWKVIFHHGTHVHPINDFVGVKNGSFTPDTVGHTAADVYYRIQLTVTDSKGATKVVNREVQPQKSQITLQTSPAGLKLDLDGQQVATPSSTVSVVGVQRELNAPLTQSANGKTYEFVSWSDGGAARHVVSTSPDNITYTATYREANTMPPPNSGTTLEAEAMTLPSGSGQNFADATASAGQGKLIWSNAAATGQLTTPASGRVTVRAKGDQCNGAPQMVVKLDNVDILSTPVAATTWTDYGVDVPVSAATHTISVAFTNDFKVTGGCDRNLRLDKVTFGSGSGTPPPPPTGSSNVKIYAAGKPAGGIYPTMELLVDGVVAKTFTDVRGGYDTRQFLEYTHTSSSPLSIGQLRVRFTNDGNVGTEDRNLKVDRVVLDGTTYQIEAPNVYSNYGTSGCTSGNKQSETLFCNGFFQL